jgi:hypothetical protein
MPTIRKRGQKYQVQVRRLGQRQLTRSFLLLKHANAWARQVELEGDRRGLPPDTKALQRITALCAHPHLIIGLDRNNRQQRGHHMDKQSSSERHGFPPVGPSASRNCTHPLT